MKQPFTISLVFLAATVSVAQHEHHQMQQNDTVRTTRKTTSKHDAHNAHQAVNHNDSTSIPMSHSYSLNLPMNRNGSGTGWLTDSSPMYGYMLHSRKWMYMIHGNIFLRYNNQDIEGKGVRGDAKIDAPNWFMAMGQRRIGQRGLFHFNTMFSLDPLFGGDGYPLLFQTGETFEGRPLVDRQHPHNLFSELSIAYTHSFNKDIDAFVYVGFPGEPALGPVAFMHRPSSLNNLDSPLGHHWQDATHITFGVATVGIRYSIIKVDASIFTGREPGEARYGFDEPRFDSYSYRLAINPARTISGQVSRAFLKSPEDSAPDEDINRTTASITHSIPIRRENQFLSSTFVWGFNDSGEDHQENSFTFESNLQLDRLAVYGRYENIEKSASELQIPIVDDHMLFNINAATIGFNYIVYRNWNTNLAVGAQGTIYSADQRLDSIYGNTPKSLEIYMRISPGIMALKPAQ